MHEIKKGDKFEIKIGAQTYNGFVHEYIEDDFIMVNIANLCENAVASTLKKCVISFMFDGGIISFDADFIEMCKQDHLSLVRLKHNSEGERIYRREFLRCECSLPIRFAVVKDIASAPEVEEDQPAAQQLSEGSAKDIGGGGMRFVTNTEVENGDTIKFLLLLEGEYLIIVGKILHKYKMSLSLAKFQYRVIFIDISPEDREKIVKFVFDEHKKAGNSEKN